MNNCLSIFFGSALITMFIAACDNSHTVIGQTSTGVDESYVLNPNPDATLFANAQSAFNARCLSCHGSGGIGGQINFATLIADGFVIQGPASESVMFRCVNSPTCIARDGQSVGNMISLGSLSQLEADDIMAYIDDLYLDPMN